MPITAVTKLEIKTRTLVSASGIPRKEVLSSDPCLPCLHNAALDPAYADIPAHYGAQITVKRTPTPGRDPGPAVIHLCRSHAIMLLGTKAVTEALQGWTYLPKETSGEKP